MFASGSMNKNVERNQALIREIMLEVDKNQDNFISFEEFNNVFTHMLQKSV